jgi:EpsI family protein
MEKIKRSSLISLIAVFAVLAAYTYLLRYREVNLTGTPDLDLIPERVDEYTSRSFELGTGSLEVLGADTTLVRKYSSEGGEDIEFFMGFFRTQQENSQIHSPKHCYPGSGWDIIRENSIELGSGNGAVGARSILLSDGSVKRLVVYLFYINERTITDEFSLKWEQMKLALLGKPQAAAFIRFSVILPSGKEEEALKELEGFIMKVRPKIDLSLKRIL